MWDAADGRCLRQFGQECHVGDPDKVPRVSPPPPWFSDEPMLGLKQVAFSADGKALVTWGWDGQLRLWDPATEKALSQTQMEGDRVVAAEAMAPDGRGIALYGGDAATHLLDPHTGRMRTLAGRVVPRPMVFSATGRTLALVEAHLGRVQLWEVATGKCRADFEPPQFVRELAISPDGRTLATIQRDGVVLFWDTLTGTVIKRLPVGRRSLVCFAPQRQFLAFVDQTDQSIVVWDWLAEKELARFQGHLRPVNCLSFAPDGRTLASGSSDRTVLLWDLRQLLKESKTPPARKTEELDDKRLGALWNDLASEDAALAFQAIWKLAEKKQGVPYLRAIPVVGDEQLARLVADLDSDRFDTRDKASAELEKLGVRAEVALRKVMAGKPSLETGRRVERLLQRLLALPLPAEEIQAVRGVEALELAGTPEARQALEAVAAGAPGVLRTKEARAALQRLAHVQP